MADSVPLLWHRWGAFCSQEPTLVKIKGTILCFALAPHTPLSQRSAEVRKATLWSGSWLGRKVEDKENMFLCKEGRISHSAPAPLALRKGMSLRRSRRRLLIRDSPPGNPSSPCGYCSQYSLKIHQLNKHCSLLSLITPTNLYLGESLLL